MFSYCHETAPHTLPTTRQPKLISWSLRKRNDRSSRKMSFEIPVLDGHQAPAGDVVNIARFWIFSTSSETVKFPMQICTIYIYISICGNLSSPESAAGLCSGIAKWPSGVQTRCPLSLDIEIWIIKMDVPTKRLEFYIKNLPASYVHLLWAQLE